MYRLTVSIVAIVLLLAGTETASAQSVPDPDRLIRRWANSQVEAGRDVRQITFEEKTQRTLDGPFGSRKFEVHAQMLGNPRSNAWRRAILSAFANGRELLPEEYERLERSRDRLEGRLAERFLEALLIPPRLLAQMQPVGSPSRDRALGSKVWRFDVAPPTNRRMPIRRVTVWLDESRSRLLQTRAVVQQPGNGASLLVTTSYNHVQGIDVPVRRHVEGTVQTRRRLRTFTLLLRVDSEYFDYRIDRP